MSNRKKGKEEEGGRKEIIQIEQLGFIFKKRNK